MDIRKLVIVATLSLLIFGCTNMPTIDFEPVTYQEVVEQPDQSKEQLFNSLRQWFSEYFVSGESVIDYEDKEAGTIIGKGRAIISTDPLTSSKHTIRLTIRIDTKDGKYKLETKIIEHLVYNSTMGEYSAIRISEIQKNSADQHVKDLAQSIANYVAENGSDKSEDW